MYNDTARKHVFFNQKLIFYLFCYFLFTFQGISNLLHVVEIRFVQIFSIKEWTLLKMY